MTGETRYLTWIWRASLLFFVLAGMTGAAFRLGVAGVSVWDLSLGNIRHAHSHAMFFGWVTPALMAFIGRHVAWRSGRPIRPLPYAIGSAFVTALLAYPPFLFFGYSPAVIGDATLPASVIAAGLNVLAWYGFVWLYIRRRDELEATASIRLFDAAIFFLVGATLGAWGLPVIQALSPASEALKTSLTHVFLEFFSEGWFVLGVLGLAASGVEKTDARVNWGLRMAVGGIPFLFVLGMPRSLVSATFEGLGLAGAIVSSAGLILIVTVVWARRSEVLWRIALGALVLKAAILLLAAAGGEAEWMNTPPFRILYIHIMLVGFVTIGLVAAARDGFGAARNGSFARIAMILFTAACLTLLLSLVPLTPVWPDALCGRWILWFAAGAAIVAALSAIPMAVRRSER